MFCPAAISAKFLLKVLLLNKKTNVVSKERDDRGASVNDTGVSGN